MYRLGLRPTLPKIPDVRLLVMYAWPFGLAGIAVKVYSYVDTLFIERLYGTIAVAMYAAAYKLTYALQFLPLTFTAALYPALAAAFAEKRAEDLRTTLGASLRAMAALGALLSAGLSALAGPIMMIVYGTKYQDAIPVFRVLPWVLLPIFLDFPIGSFLNATHRAVRKTTAMLMVMVVNVALNAVLVPLFGPRGAAFAALGSFWILVLIGLV
jgi:O-antigen/teichoic acid export membrane protein